MKKKRTVWSQDEIDYLKNNYKNKKNREISEFLNRTMSAVEIKAKRLGLLKPKIRYYDDSIFSEINNEESAYWLGFIMADGYITYDTLARNYELGIELKNTEENHLKKFAKFMKTNAKITYRTKKCNHFNKITTKSVLIRIYCKKIVDNLIKHGIEPRKTGKENIPKIKNDLFIHFLRGFFDGDGSIYKDKKIKFYKTNITCMNEDFLKCIRKILYDKYNIISNVYCYTNSYKTKMYKLCIHRKRDNLFFLELLYKDSKIYLDRKYKLYLRNCLNNQ